jgi:TPR repeat protein/energy-coupling factor transporter ATP-binding protein EcfA2
MLVAEKKHEDRNLSKVKKIDVIPLFNSLSFLKEDMPIRSNVLKKFYVKAKGFYEENQCQPYAVFRLGLLYLYGYGVDRDAVKAYALIEKAAQQGDTQAKIYLSKQNNLNKNKSNILSIDLPIADYEKAFLYGNFSAAEKLGDLYAKEGDEEKSIYYYELAADHGCIKSQAKIAGCYWNGKKGKMLNWAKAQHYTALYFAGIDNESMDTELEIEFYKALGEQQEFAEHFEEARQFYMLELQAQLKHCSENYKIVPILLELLPYYEKSEHIEKALAICKYIIRIQEFSGFFHYISAKICMKIGSISRAKECILKAVQAYSERIQGNQDRNKDAPAYYRMGQIIRLGLLSASELSQFNIHFNSDYYFSLAAHEFCSFHTEHLFRLKAKKKLEKQILKIIQLEKPEKNALKIIKDLIALGASLAEVDDPVLNAAERNLGKEVADYLRLQTNQEKKIFADHSGVDQGQLEKLLIDAFKAVETGANKDIILLLGNTGSGKSTLVNYLLHCSMKAYNNPKTNKKYVIVAQGFERAKIGMKHSDSATLYPEIFQSQEGHFYCDCPGFGDSRGLEYQICAPIAIKSAIHFARNVRALILVIDWPSVESNRANGLRKAFQALREFLTNNEGDAVKLETLQKSIIFVFTKTDLVPTSIDLSNILQCIEEIKIEQEKLETAEAAVIVSVCQLLLKNPNHVIQANSLDSGESRKKILDCIAQPASIPPRVFGFPGETAVKKECRGVVERISAEGLQLIQNINNKTKAIKRQLQERLLEETTANAFLEKIKELTAEISNITRDPRFADTRNAIKKNEEAIKQKQQEKEQLAAKKGKPFSMLLIQQRYTADRSSQLDREIEEDKQHSQKLEKELNVLIESRKKEIEIKKQEMIQRYQEIFLKIKRLDCEIFLLEKTLLVDKKACLKKMSSFECILKLASITALDSFSMKTFIASLSPPQVIWKKDELQESKEEEKKEVIPEKKLAEWKNFVSEGNVEIQAWLGFVYCYISCFQQSKALAAQWLEMASNEREALAGAWALYMCHENELGIFKPSMDKAVEGYRQLAMKNYAPAQFSLGLYYQSKKNFLRSIKYYHQAVNAQHPYAKNKLEEITKFYREHIRIHPNSSKELYELAMCYKAGWGVAQSWIEAARLWQLAADQDMRLAQYQLAICFEKGLGVKYDPVSALQWYDKASRYLPKAKISQLIFIQKLEDLAKAQHIEAQFALGVCYERSLGVEKNHQKARFYYQQAAMQGHASAQYHAGLCWERAWGGKESYFKALQFYHLAAEKGHVDAKKKQQQLFEECQEAACRHHVAWAQNMYGLYIQNGWEIKKDLVLAAFYFRLAARQGHREAHLNLGRCYERGEGQPQNFKKALRRYRLAAEGLPEAQLFLAKRYAKGDQLVKKDESEAMRLFHLAVNAEEKNEEALQAFEEYQRKGIREKTACIIM